MHAAPRKNRARRGEESRKSVSRITCHRARDPRPGRRRGRDGRPRAGRASRTSPTTRGRSRRDRSSSASRVSAPTATTSPRPRSRAAPWRSSSSALLDLHVPQLVVADARAAMALAADAFFGRPTRELEVAGVTGTNGKTTTAFLLYSILAAAGRRPGLLGTVEMRVGGERRAVVRTTPEAIDLQRDVPRDARRGRPQLRDGGLLARVRAPAPRRHAVPRASSSRT